MKTVVTVVVLLCVAAVCTEGRVVQRPFVGRQTLLNQPYWVLNAQRTRSNGLPAIKLPISAADLVDDEDDFDQDEATLLVNDDDDDETVLEDEVDEDASQTDDDDEQEMAVPAGNILGIIPLVGSNSVNRNYLQALLAKNGGNAGSLMVPDGIIELEGQGIVDEETGETALFVPREALANIPDGSVVALMEDTDGAGKANRVVIRRRRKGNGGNRNRNRRRRRGGNRRRPNNVRVIRGKPVRIAAGANNGNRRRRVNNLNVIRL